MFGLCVIIAIAWWEYPNFFEIYQIFVTTIDVEIYTFKDQHYIHDFFSVVQLECAYMTKHIYLTTLYRMHITHIHEAGNKNQ